MAEEKRTAKLPHNLILENRKTLSISGVIDVDRFDEESVVALTDLGELSIRGTNLHISRLSLESGDLTLDGEIASLTYTDHQPASGGFFSKLFR
jgi:sporulation protein YabP